MLPPVAPLSNELNDEAGILSDDDDSGIAGWVWGIIVIIIIGALVAALWLWRRRKQRKAAWNADESHHRGNIQFWSFDYVTNYMPKTISNVRRSLAVLNIILFAPKRTGMHRMHGRARRKAPTCHLGISAPGPCFYNLSCSHFSAAPVVRAQRTASGTTRTAPRSFAANEKLTGAMARMRATIAVRA
eukprot:2404297-Pleurochrysis_carterae.AAC.2